MLLWVEQSRSAKLSQARRSCAAAVEPRRDAR
jgi:hypothetical protein